MAEEKDLLAQLESATAAPAPAKKFPVRLVLIVLAVLLAGGGGFFAYKTFVLDKKKAAEETKKEETAKEEQKKPEVAEEAVGIMYSLEPFIVNLSGSEGKRFLKVTVTLELSSPELRAEVKENLQKITDSILILLSSKTFEDVYSVQGKFKLKDEITTRVNRFLLLGHIKDAYFTEFVIQ